LKYDLETKIYYELIARSFTCRYNEHMRSIRNRKCKDQTRIL